MASQASAPAGSSSIVGTRHDNSVAAAAIRERSDRAPDQPGLRLDTGKATGAFRADVNARDVVLLMGYLSRLERDEWDARARPLMRVILDGVRRQGYPLT